MTQTKEPAVLQATSADWDDHGETMTVTLRLIDGKAVKVELDQKAAGDIWAAVQEWWDRHSDDD